MKRALIACFAVGILAILSGCTTEQVVRHGNCGQAECTCADPGCGRPDCPHCQHRCREAFDPGPPTGAITYPYYTLRGPRDFLQRNPPSMGP